MAKKIIIDMEKLSDLYCGLGQFSLHLGREISKLGEFHFYLNPEDARHVPLGTPVELNKLHRQMPMLMPKCDIWHSTHQDSKYWPSSKKIKKVLTIHDLNGLKEAKAPKKYHSMLQKKISEATGIAFISEYTKKEVLETFKVPSIPLRVIYNGLNRDQQTKGKKPGFAPEEKFLFSIATILPKKNFHTMLPLLEKNPDYKWVLAGSTFHEYANQFRGHPQVILPGTISDEETIWLYQNCDAFLFPSLLEGFGMPVIEAMSYGKPVFLSNKTALPEIAGESAYYFPDFSAKSIQETFLNGMTDFKINPDRADKLKARANEFSWKIAAKKYIELFELI